MKSTIKKLLVSISQLNSDNLIYSYYKSFDRARETNICATKSRRLRQQIKTFLYFSSFSFKENYIFIEEDKKK